MLIKCRLKNQICIHFLFSWILTTEVHVVIYLSSMTSVFIYCVVSMYYTDRSRFGTFSTINRETVTHTWLWKINAKILSIIWIMPYKISIVNQKFFGHIAQTKHFQIIFRYINVRLPLIHSSGPMLKKTTLDFRTLLC